MNRNMQPSSIAQLQHIVCKILFPTHCPSVPEMSQVTKFRERLLAHETPEVLGGRRPSTHVSNAFGARNFQPHMALLRPGNGVDRDLTKLGSIFRQEIKSLTFDRFCIEIVLWDANGNRVKL